MIVHIRLFAVMAQDARTAGVDLELPDHARLADVRTAVRERFPGLRWPKGTMWAVNQEYAADEAHRLKAGDEIAIIPPVSGG